jgi:hypothetical protein
MKIIRGVCKIIGLDKTLPRSKEILADATVRIAVRRYKAILMFC